MTEPVNENWEREPFGLVVCLPQPHLFAYHPYYYYYYYCTFPTLLLLLHSKAIPGTMQTCVCVCVCVFVRNLTRPGERESGWLTGWLADSWWQSRPVLWTFALGLSHSSSISVNGGPMFCPSPFRSFVFVENINNILTIPNWQRSMLLPIRALHIYMHYKAAELTLPHDCCSLTRGFSLSTDKQHFGSQNESGQYSHSFTHTNKHERPTYHS